MTVSIKSAIAKRAESVKRMLSARYGRLEETNNLRYMLTDLRHYADHYGIDFAHEERVAHHHYCTERGADEGETESEFLDRLATGLVHA